MNKLEGLLIEYKNHISNKEDEQELSHIKNQYINHIEIKNLYEKAKIANNMEKSSIITQIKSFKEQVDEILQQRLKEVKSKETLVDVYLPTSNLMGSVHPMTVTINRIRTIIETMSFEGMSFKFREAPEIETCFNNFDALNIPPLHPCRTDHQSFHINDDKLLRTHTTNATAHILQENEYDNGAYFTIGKTYRKDSDATHVPMFHQWEILVIHEKANVARLLTFLKTFLNSFFQKNLKYRFRSSFFPFTRLSMEVDIWFNNRWLEVLGCGIIAPEVFEKCKSQNRMAFAVGGGVERLCMIQHSLNDIRTLYSNDKITTTFGGKI